MILTDDVIRVVLLLVDDVMLDAQQKTYCEVALNWPLNPTSLMVVLFNEVKKLREKDCLAYMSKKNEQN